MRGCADSKSIPGTLTAMQRFEDAESSMLEAHAILESAIGPDHERTTGVIKHIADLYDAWHESAPGNGYDAKAAEWPWACRRSPAHFAA